MCARRPQGDGALTRGGMRITGVLVHDYRQSHKDVMTVGGMTVTGILVHDTEDSTALHNTVCLVLVWMFHAAGTHCSHKCSTSQGCAAEFSFMTGVCSMHHPPALAPWPYHDTDLSNTGTIMEYWQFIWLLVCFPTSSGYFGANFSNAVVRCIWARRLTTGTPCCISLPCYCFAAQLTCAQWVSLGTHGGHTL